MLHCLDVPDVEFVVVPPAPFFPDYLPEIDDDTAARLGLSDADDAVVLLIVTLGERAADASANLRGPVVVNRRTRAAAQAVLATSSYPLRAPLVASS